MSMPRPYASGVVPASSAEVWEKVRPFNGLPAWHPAIETSTLTEGVEGQVGAVRRLTLADGGIVIERLTVLDDDDCTYTYVFDGPNPFGVRRYLSTVRVAPITDTGHAFVEWWGEFDAEGADEERLTELFRDGVYAAGIAGLQGQTAG
jgi:Polyketide cyclase / dehydrase and lipid transport